MPSSTCQTCHRLIPLGKSHCERHKPRRLKRNRPSAAKRGLGHEYRTNRDVVLSVSRVCILCGSTGADTADHLLPRDDGGTNALHNLAPAHLSCNSRRQKRALTPKQLSRVRAFQRMLARYLNS